MLSLEPWATAILAVVTQFFWGDVWSDNCLKDLFPHLYSFAKKKKSSVIFYLNGDLKANYFLPLSVQASEELEALEMLLQMHD